MGNRRPGWADWRIGVLVRILWLAWGIVNAIALSRGHTTGAELWRVATLALWAMVGTLLVVEMVMRSRLRRRSEWPQGAHRNPFPEARSDEAYLQTLRRKRRSSKARQ